MKGALKTAKCRAAQHTTAVTGPQEDRVVQHSTAQAQQNSLAVSALCSTRMARCTPSVSTRPAPLSAPHHARASKRMPAGGKDAAARTSVEIKITALHSITEVEVS